MLFRSLDFDNCNLTEVIKVLQKLAKTPNASKMNLAFTKHITSALIEVREERLKCRKFKAHMLLLLSRKIKKIVKHYNFFLKNFEDIHI